jgi:hypothetical protein
MIVVGKEMTLFSVGKDSEAASVEEVPAIKKS